MLVERRAQRMLHGLYVFHLIEEETEPGPVGELLLEQGLRCAFQGELGRARHVFTHRVWEMSILHYRLNAPPAESALEALDARMVTADELEALPLPTAMKTAREKATVLLRKAR